MFGAVFLDSVIFYHKRDGSFFDNLRHAALLHGFKVAGAGFSSGDQGLILAAEIEAAVP